MLQTTFSDPPMERRRKETMRSGETRVLDGHRLTWVNLRCHTPVDGAAGQGLSVLNHVCIRQEHLAIWDIVGQQLIETLM